MHPVGRVLIAVLLIAIFEGAIRKWVWFGSAPLLLFIRDSLVVGTLAVAAVKGWLRLRTWPESLLMIWTGLVAAWAFLQVILGEQSFLVGLLGIRSWLLYLWFAWLCARTLSYAEVRSVALMLAWLSIPMAALAVVQHFLPPHHILNRQAEGDDTMGVYMVAGQIVRVTGTFSFNIGYGQFVIFAAPLALSFLWSEGPHREGQWFRWLAVAAFATAVVVSGARTIFIIVAGVFVAAFLATLLNRQLRFSFLLPRLLLVVALAASIPQIFSRSLDAIGERFETAAKSEVLIDRIAWAFFGESSSWAELDVLGKGIGLGNNAAAVLGGGERTFVLGEAEPDRILREAGLLGLVFIFIKIGIALLGCFRALRVARTEGDLFPWLLWTAVSIELIGAQITSQLSVHAFGWLALGLAWASLNRPARATYPAGHSGFGLPGRPRLTRTPIPGLRPSGS